MRSEPDSAAAKGRDAIAGRIPDQGEETRRTSLRRRSQAALFALAGIFFVVFAMRVSQPPEPVYGGKTVGQWANEVKVAVGVVRTPGRTMVFPSSMSDEDLAGLSSFMLTNRNAKIMGGAGGTSAAFVFTFTDGDDDIWLSSDPTVEKDTATAALKGMGARAVPYLTAQLDKRNSVFVIWYYNLWKELPRQFRGILRAPRSAAAQRARAAQALGLIGPAAKEAVPALARLSEKDEYPFVRSVAFEAIKRIDPK